MKTLLQLPNLAIMPPLYFFNGYLPAEPKARQIKLGILQDLVLKHGQTQIFIETPFRNQHLLASLLQHLNGEIVLTIAIDLMNEKNEEQNVHIVLEHRS